MTKKAEAKTNEKISTDKKITRPQKTFPSYSIEEALKIPKAIAKKQCRKPLG